MQGKEKVKVNWRTRQKAMLVVAAVPVARLVGGGSRSGFQGEEKLNWVAAATAGAKPRASDTAA